MFNHVNVSTDIRKTLDIKKKFTGPYDFLITGVHCTLLGELAAKRYTIFRMPYLLVGSSTLDFLRI